MSEVTLALIAQNEEAYIDQCLRYHKPFFDRIIVLDGDSVDRTVEIAEGHGAKVYQERGDFVSFATRRNFLAAQCETDWVLMVDADELFDWNFMNNIRGYVGEEGANRKKDVVAFKFPRINLDNGHPIDYHVRLYLKDVCEWEGAVHEKLVLKDTRERVDQAKVNGHEICQILDGHNIIHLQRPGSERVRQRERWKEIEKGEVE